MDCIFFKIYPMGESTMKMKIPVHPTMIGWLAKG